MDPTVRARSTIGAAVVATFVAAGGCGPPETQAEQLTLASSRLRITETMDGPNPPEASPDGGVALPAPGPKVAAPRPPPPAPPDARGCTTTCKADSYSPIPTPDEPIVAVAVTPHLAALRECLDRVSAENVRPLIHLRFTDDGVLTNVRVDVGGYEDLGCVKQVASTPLRAATTRGTTMHCELRCPPAPRRAAPAVRFRR